MYKEKRIHLIIITFCLLLIIPANAQRLTPDQEKEFQRKIENLLALFENVSEMTIDGEEIDADMAGKLKETFVNSNRRIVLNDLLPDGEDGQKRLSPLEYVNLGKMKYPTGLDVEIEILNIDIKDYDQKNKTCEAIVKTNKNITGFYLNKKIHRWSGVVFFYIQASLDGADIDQVNISRMADEKRHEQVQANKRYRGLYIGVKRGQNHHMINSEAIEQNKNWNTPLDQENILSFELHYMFSRGFGLATGIRYGNYSPALELENYSGQASSTTRDKDNDYYFPVIDISNLREEFVFETTEIPLFMKFRTGRGTLGLFLDLGAVITSYKSMSSKITEGTATRKGYYPEYNVTLEDIPEYDFFSNKNISNENSQTLTPPESMQLSGLVSTGFSIGLVKNMIVTLGVSANYGLTDIFEEGTPEHPFNFENITGNSMGETVFHSASIDIGLRYRIIGY